MPFLAKPHHPLIFEFISPPKWEARVQQAHGKAATRFIKNLRVLFLGRADRIADPQHYTTVVTPASHHRDGSRSVMDNPDGSAPNASRMAFTE